MTPQLQQAIRLLQLSALELSAEIQDALDSNMMLEVAESGDDLDEQGSEHTPDPETDFDQEFEAPQEIAGGDPMEQETLSTTVDIPNDLPVDTEWDDIYDTLPTSGMTTGQAETPDAEYERADSASQTLAEHLLWQLNLLPISSADKTIAATIIDALDSDGYLQASITDLCETLKEDESDDLAEEEIAAVLKMVQSLDPTGVAARDLSECLRLQLAQLDSATPWLEEAQRCCSDLFSLLGGRDYTQLMRKLQLSKNELAQVIALIQSLNPRPGSPFDSGQTEYIVPDVFVSKHNNRWRVELNPETAPPLRVNPYYASLVRRSKNEDDQTSMRAHLQEAKWFIKSLQSRSETLLKVSSAIVERQQAFLEHGEEAMRPLVLHDIADTLEMHESTISRVTTRKYMHTPKGIFELKFFFSSHLSTTLGGEASSTAIRAVIKKIIAAENCTKPLSDNKIAALLSEQGVQVARRTVAKYREAMAIPPSNERKRLA